VPGEVRQQYDVVTLQLDSRLWGQHLSYIGGYSNQRFRNTEERDTGQNLIGAPFYAYTLLRKEDTSHEIRLSSDPAPGRFFDYVVGVYYGWQETHPTSYNLQTASFLPPAFGSPAAPSLAAFNPMFQIPLRVLVSSTAQDTSAFGSLTLHLGSKTEITGGLRHLWTVGTAPVRVTLENGLTAVPPGVPCQLAGLQPGPAAGICVVPTAAVVALPAADRFHEEHTIYNVSLSHRFTRDLLVYGNVGTSFRPQYASTGLLNAGNDPILATFGAHPSEKSRGFEVGVKWSFLNRRGRLNAAIFRQKFRNLPVYTSPVPYVANNGASISVQQYQFTANPDAIVEGFDIDAAFQITPNWSISGQVSYADGRATTDIPCNDSNFDGSPEPSRASVNSRRACSSRSARAPRSRPRPTGTPPCRANTSIP
jgi:iron complex outermembrane receptor protein